jgi:glycosyltransferase involved in cell wall biosynthesis
MSSVCILVFSNVQYDSRIQRQVRFLVPYHDIIIFGLGTPPDEWLENPRIFWRPIEEIHKTASTSSVSQPDPPPSLRKGIIGNFTQYLPLGVEEFLKYLFLRVKWTLNKVLYHFFIFLGLFTPLWYWRIHRYRRVFKEVLRSGADVFYANEIETLPIMAEAARLTRKRFIFDIHEYWWRHTTHWWFKPIMKPARRRLIQFYAPQAAATMTVTPILVEKYRQEFGLDPLLVLNTPEYVEVHPHEVNPEHINLICHGTPSRNRREDKMIEAISLSDLRYHLHLMTAPNTRDPGYLDELKALAERIAPGRVTFHDAVPREKVVQTIAQYDMGIYILAPTFYNHVIALPNRFFDFIVAGLAICVGPSLEMSAIVKQYHIGCVAPSFEPHDVADTLNQLTIEDIRKMRAASREASHIFNAEVEMEKVVSLINKMLEENTIKERG